MLRKLPSIILIISLAIMILPGCERKCGGTYYVPQDCKDYGYFLKGSYWIYQNDSTLELDSFTTVYDTTKWIVYPVGTEGCNEQTNTNAPFYNKLESTISTAFSNISADTIEYRSDTWAVEIFVNNRFMGIYFTPEARQHTDTSKWELLNDIVINGNLYSDVYESTYPDSAKLFFEQNVGIIKFERSSDTTDFIESWSIVRYHVIQ